MSRARTEILARLRRAPKTDLPERPQWNAPVFADKFERFRSMIEAVHGEVHQVSAAAWPERLRTILANKGVETVIAAPVLCLDQVWAGQGPNVVAYDQPVEVLKDDLVDAIGAAVTTTRGAIAETGTLVLWPDVDQPRLMSLLPPIHVALLNKNEIVDNLAEIMTAQNWAGSMPTNVLLISGPSKTADIEQTLAYGVHGPKELIVLVLTE